MATGLHVIDQGLELEDTLFGVSDLLFKFGYLLWMVDVGLAVGRVLMVELEELVFQW